MSRRGFTLVEVLVSLAIFALAAVVLGAAYVNVLTSYEAVSRRSEYEQELRWIRTVVLAEPDLTVVEKGGNLSLPQNGAATWAAKVEPMAVADLFRVNLHVEITEPGRSGAWTRDESFVLLRPTWSVASDRDQLRQATQQRLQKSRTP